MTCGENEQCLKFKVQRKITNTRQSQHGPLKKIEVDCKRLHCQVNES